MKKLLVALLSLVSASAYAAEFKAGVGRKVITPTSPMWLSGYASRNHPSDGVIHDLWAKALVVEDAQGGRAAIVSTDLIGLPRELTDEVAARLAKKHKLERSQILLGCSHTHCAPAVWPNLRVMFDMPAEDEQRAAAYAARLTDDLVAVVDEAIGNLAPAEISIGHGSVGFGMNRREPAETGIRLGVNPKGPVDHDVPVVRVASPEGKLRAALFGYACHGTTLGGDFYKINGDFAGFAEADFEKAHPDATAMFLILCGADQNPDPRGKLENAEAHGKTLATEVGRVLSEKLRPVRPPIRTAWKLAQLDFAPHDRATFEEQAKSTNRYIQRRAQIMLKAYDAGQPMRQLELPVQAIRLGNDLTLVAIGGEVVVDYALRLKREYPKENLMVVGYANDVPCYIPTLRILREKGYEVVDSMIYYGRPGPFAENVEDKVIGTCREVLKATGAADGAQASR